MRLPDYYKKLNDAAKRKNKNELEVYQCVSKKVDDILQEDSEQDKAILIKALIAYFEARLTYSWYTAIIPVAYALVICAVSLMPYLDIAVDDLRKMTVTLLVCTVVVIIVAYFNLDFEKKMVICVLNDKLQEYSKVKEAVSNTVTKTNQTVVPENKKYSNQGKRNKKNRKRRKR